VGTTDVRRRAFTLGAGLASVGLGASWLGLDSGASGAPRSGPPALRAGVLGGVEEEVLRFVAAQSPSLGLSVERFGQARELRRALLAGKLAFGSFENALELENAPENSQHQLVSAGAAVTLPLGFYSRRLRRLSELVPGSRVLLPEEPNEQGRALLVLYHYGLVGFAEELGPFARLKDVTANKRQLELVPLPGNALPERLERDDLVALSYQQAAQLGLAPARNALALEDGFSPFAQVLTVRRETEVQHLARPAWREQLLAAYRAPVVKDFILQRFEDSVRRAW
jgi:D-methionine transport system substrate-binding protein